MRTSLLKRSVSLLSTYLICLPSFSQTVQLDRLPAPQGSAQPDISLSISLDGRVQGGNVSVGVAGRSLSVREVWRSHQERQLKYDVAQAYAQYYCGSSNVLNAEGAWQPGYGKREGYFTYDDTVKFECIREQSILGGAAPGGIKWSKFGAAAWLLPGSNAGVVRHAEVRFGTLRPSEATALIQFALYHMGDAVRKDVCGQARLPAARFIETRRNPADRQGDATLTAEFVCDRPN